jgi:hypothetical protein
MTDTMSRAERLELAKLVRLRANVAKKDIEQRQAQLIADFEEQLAANYASTHEAWADVTSVAKKLVEEVDAEIARRCKELGLPEKYRPSLDLRWYGRGESASRERRAELRKVAQAKLEASAKGAKVEVDRSAAALLTQLTAGSLESSEAQEFLGRMPSIDQLMPPLTVGELDPDLAAAARLRERIGPSGPPALEAGGFVLDLDDEIIERTEP